MSGWIGVDLDGTLAKYESWQGSQHIGEPIQPMVHRIRVWLSQGQEVRIFTARVSGYWIGDKAEAKIAHEAIDRWCMEQFGVKLPVTSVKDYAMIDLWDDRCVQVIPNTGRTIADELEAEKAARAGKP